MKEPWPVPVLYLVGSWVVGGSETQLYNLMTNLDRRRFVPILCEIYTSGQMDRLAREHHMVAFSLGVSHIARPATLPKLLFLRNFIRKHSIKIIHALRTEAVAVPVARASGRRVVIGAQRELAATENMPRLHRVASRVSDRWVDGVIANSQAAKVARVARTGISPKKVCVIPNGVDTQKFAANGFDPVQARAKLGLDQNGPVIGVIGRLSPEKGHDDLLEAFGMLCGQGVDGTLLVVGDGACRPSLEQQASRLGLAKRVVFLGLREDVPQLMAAMDLVVVSSTSESSPNVVLEAMACGKPVVATNVGGIPELITHEENGLLVRPQDPKGLASAMRRLLHEPSPAEKLTQNAQSLVSSGRFSLQTMVDKTVGLYETLLRQKGLV